MDGAEGGGMIAMKTKANNGDDMRVLLGAGSSAADASGRRGDKNGERRMDDSWKDGTLD